MNLGKFFSLILLGLLGALPLLASPLFSLPTFLKIEIPNTGLKDASVFDRAVVAQYQFEIRGPQNRNLELREKIKRELGLSEAQLQAVKPFFPVRGKIMFTPDDLFRARREFGFEYKDLNRYSDFKTRFQAFAHIRNLDNSFSEDVNALLDGFATDVVTLIDKPGVKAQQVRAIFQATASKLNEKDKARFLSSFIKAEMIKMVVARNLQTNIIRAEAGQIAAELLKPLLVGNEQASKFMFDEFLDMSMTHEVEYYDPLKVLLEPMSDYARKADLWLVLESLTEKTIEQFRKTGYLNDFPYTYDTAERMRIYLDRYALDMSLRSPVERSLIATENIKSVLRSGAKNIEDIVRRDQLLAEVLKYVQPEHLASLVSSLLLRTEMGEVVSLGFLRPLVRRLDDVPNETLDPVFASVSSESNKVASFQQIDFMLELFSHRADVSDLMRSVLRKKLKRKIVLGVFLAKVSDVHSISRELERYRALLTRAEFVDFLEESAQDAADFVQKETVFMGDVIPWRQAVDHRLSNSALFTLLGRYLNATGGDVTPTTDSCNRLLYGDVADLVPVLQVPDGEVVPFRR